VTIGQAGVGTQVTDGFVTMAYAMLVAIGLVYLLLVMLVHLLLAPMVIFFALPLIVIGAFVVVAVTGRALDLSAHRPADADRHRGHQRHHAARPDAAQASRHVAGWLVWLARSRMTTLATPIVTMAWPRGPPHAR
jgi:fatty acid desaturase